MFAKSAMQVFVTSTILPLKHALRLGHFGWAAAYSINSSSVGSGRASGFRRLLPPPQNQPDRGDIIAGAVAAAEWPFKAAGREILGV